MSKMQGATEPHIVVLGDPKQGFSFQGPFPGKFEAGAWASRHHADEVWWSAPLINAEQPEALEEDASGTYLVVTGNPADGFFFYGTFEDAAFATEWAGEQIPDDTWWVTPLRAPVIVDDGEEEEGDAIAP